MSDEDRLVRHADETIHDEQSPLLPALESPSDKRTRPRKGLILSLIALIVVLFFLFLASALVLPKRAQSYVEETLQVEVASISVINISDKGATLQVSGDIFLNETGTEHRAFDRRLTHAILAILGPIETSESTAELALNAKDLTTIAIADLGALKISLAKEEKSRFNLSVAVNITDAKSIGRFAAEVLQGEVNTVPLLVTVNTILHRWISIRKSVAQRFKYTLFNTTGSLPEFNITTLAVQDSQDSGIVGQVALETEFRTLVNVQVPSVNVQVSIEGCKGELIPVATGKNLPFNLRNSNSKIAVNAVGECRELPAEAFEKCPDTSGQSPIDRITQRYLAGNTTTVFISGPTVLENQSWIQKLLTQVTVPIDLPGSGTDQLARDIELLDVKFNLPSFLGGGGKPKISGKVRGVIDVPTDINVDVKIDSVHVLADLLYKKRKFATIESPGWSPAVSKFRAEKELQVEVVLRDAPVTITNQDIFSSVVSELLGGNVLVDVLGTGDVKVTTALGNLEAHELPIEARDIEIGGFGFLGDLRPEIKELGVLRTDRKSMELVAVAEVDNPTTYEAFLNYFDALITFQNRTLGNITVEDATISQGKNRIRARLRYGPELFESAPENFKKGSELLSQYLSEKKVAITLQAHRASLPDFPNLSHALAFLPLQFSMPVPRLIPRETDGGDDDGDDDGSSDDSTGSQFLVSAKFHLFSSTASFVLRNPLNETITVTDLQAVAVYHDDTIGTLKYGYPIILPGDKRESETTRIPVSWRLPASDILKRALGGTLKVNATANATVSVGAMHGIPVSITLRDVGAGVGL